MKTNVQQQPKTPGYMECWHARPGHYWIQIDFVSVEPKLVTQVSRDTSYWRLYGPNANPAHDVYLYVGSQLTLFRDKFAPYYDLDNPQPELIAEAKKLYKHDRDACKKFHLSGMYGAGVERKYNALTIEGFNIPIEEIAMAHDEYWHRIFPGVREYIRQLKREWARRGGWVLNPLGRPLCVAEEFTKDLLNRVAQSGGHDLLRRLLWHINRLRKARRLPLYPVIVDLHDETIWEGLCGTEQDAVALFNEALRCVNEDIQWEVQITGTPEIVQNLAEIKCEGYKRTA